MRTEKSKTSVPDFMIQIVHLEGPRRGQIDELHKERISVGRNPDSDVCFPKDLRIISRRHAEILNLGGRFLLRNLSKNGCLVNGKPTQIKYLQQGDIFTFAEGGPKARFQYVRHVPAPVEVELPQAANASITIQLGFNIKAVQRSAVSLGSATGCDFVISHAHVLAKHAQLSVRSGEYFLRDLSLTQATLLNGRPVVNEVLLQNKDVIGLGKEGPQLLYLGSGCFAEVRARMLPRIRKGLPPEAM
ncbi:MAG: FHA domain-containing protein [Gammaproteobacteria bacterium]|nr:FHA domain-containing protein [Gammaproteobacteria bacterium]